MTRWPDREWQEGRILIHHISHLSALHNPYANPSLLYWVRSTDSDSLDDPSSPGNLSALLPGTMLLCYLRNWHFPVILTYYLGCGPLVKHFGGSPLPVVRLESERLTLFMYKQSCSHTCMKPPKPPPKEVQAGG